MSTMLVLTMLNFDKIFVVECDASGTNLVQSSCKKEDSQQTFDSLKHAMSTILDLTMPNFDKIFVL